MTSSGSVHGICSPVIRRRLSAFSLGFRISSMDWNSSSPMLEDPTREHALQEGRTGLFLSCSTLSFSFPFLIYLLNAFFSFFFWFPLFFGFPS